ncbi:MAG: hypothetical protein K2Z81_17960, partial [Cyanobacteria bacterium]|nr:hypothetical protein [Cyanobacteriota bacterium]
MDDFFNARPLAQAEANASVGQLQAGNLFEQRTPTQGPSMRRIDDADVRRVTVAAEERNIVPLVQLLDQLPDVDSRVNLLRRVDQENANRRRTLT